MSPQALPQAGPRYPTRQEVDFVIVGSGAAGGVMARELSRAGFSVVVLEQGPYRRPVDFRHDELDVWINHELTGSLQDFPTTYRRSADAPAQRATEIAHAYYARGVGGSSVHFTANYWRFRPVDFDERSRLGSIPGADLRDWPISYDDLEPYYTKVDWDIGVSGAPGPHDPPRSRPYPHPPLAIKSSGVLLERGARAMGWNPQPAPMAIITEARAGRAPCNHCGFCMGYGCEFNAKSSTLASVIPEAEQTGRCEIRPESTVFRLDTDSGGRVRQVVYWDRDGAEQAQRARAVVVCANGAETPRLLLSSESNRFPDGLANSSGAVGKYLMFNGNAGASGQFEHPLNEYKGAQVTRIVLDWYNSDPARGFYGGGGIDGRFFFGPVMFGLSGLPPEAPYWGAEFKQTLSEAFTHSMDVACHSTSLPRETNTITLDPDVTDTWGRPVVRVTYEDHPDDLAMMEYLQARALEVLDAAGATKTWSVPVAVQEVGFHLLGTCRMGTDPGSSVIDPDHRTHDVPNLFISDGSSLVTSGRGQPTMTIQALAFRAADRIGALASRGEI